MIEEICLFRQDQSGISTHVSMLESAEGLVIDMIKRESKEGNQIPVEKVRMMIEINQKKGIWIRDDH